VKGRHAVFLPHTAGRYQSRPFRKTACPIVERLVNSMMMHGRNNGKKLSALTTHYTTPYWYHPPPPALSVMVFFCQPSRRLAMSDVREE